MPIRVVCKNGHKLNAPDNLAGRTIKCPKCSVPVAIKIAEEVQPLEVTALESAQSDFSDPFGTDPFGSNSSPTDPFGVDPFASDAFGDNPSATDPFAADPLSAGNYAAPAQGIPASGARVSASGKKNLRTQSSTGSAWQIRLLIACAGVFCGLVFGGLFAYLLWPRGGSTGYAGSKPKLIESQALRAAQIARISAFKAEEGSSPDKIKEQIEQEIAYARELYPEAFLVTPATETLIQSGKPDPSTKRRQETLLRGIKEIFKTEMNLTAGPVGPADSEVLFHHLAAEWRSKLLHLESTDMDQWQAIQKIEQEVFGPFSIFQKLKEPMDVKENDSANVVSNFGKIALALVNFESSYKRLPSSNGLPVIKNGGLSWRVAILPMLGYETLFREFKLDESWDSPHNKALIAKMPREFKTPGVNGVGMTAVHGAQGVNCIFVAQEPRRLSDVTDGLANVAMLILGGPQTAEEWTNPAGLILDPSKGLEQLGNPAFDVFASGNFVVRTLPSDLNAAEFRQLVAIADGLPDKGSFDSKYPKFALQQGRASKILANLRSIDPTKK